MGTMKLFGMSCLAVGIGVLAGCGSNDFGTKAGIVIQSAPIHLDAEYVILSPAQVGCGVENELWDSPSSSEAHSVAKLMDKGRALKFASDVIIGEMKNPYIQVRGDFPLSVLEVQADRPGPQPESKLADVKLGVPIDHSCFPRPLVMMGVRKGNFTQDYPPTLLFKFNSDWYFDKIVH